MTGSDRREFATRLAWSIRRRGLGVLTAAVVAVGPGASFAQAPPAAKSPASSVLDVPTTKLLAIGSWTAQASPARWQPILTSEARATTLLYFDGTIDEWFVKQDHTGVVFLLNLTDPGQAKALLDKLPLGRAGLMGFQIIPLGPLSPLRLLFSQPKHN